MTEIDPSTVALTMISQYPRWYSGKLRSMRHTDKIRGDLALESIQLAAKAGYRVVVVDGFSTKTFKKAVSATAEVLLIRRKSHTASPARRLAFARAAKLPGVKVIISLEPEKVSLVKEGILAITKPFLENTADIVIPKRDPALFEKTYPTYQYESEIEGNKLYNEQLKLHGLLPQGADELDFFFGPRAFRNEKYLVGLFMKRFSLQLDGPVSEPEGYSNTLYFPIVLALHKRLRVRSVKIPFTYPPLQKDNEEGDARSYFEEKRRAQRMNLLLELMHFINFLERRQQSKIRYKR